MDELALAAGAQRIVAAGSLAGRRMRARLAIIALDLARLPRALVPPALALAGRLDLEAAASGSVTRPQGKARLMLRDGRFRKIDHVDLTLAASHDGHRLRADVQARAPLAQASARLDLPAAWPPPDDAALAVDLKVAPFDVAPLLAAAGGPTGARGRASLDAHVEGTAARPTAPPATTSRPPPAPPASSGWTT